MREQQPLSPRRAPQLGMVVGGRWRQPGHRAEPGVGADGAVELEADQQGRLGVVVVERRERLGQDGVGVGAAARGQEHPAQRERDRRGARPARRCERRAQQLLRARGRGARGRLGEVAQHLAAVRARRRLVERSA